MDPCCAVRRCLEIKQLLRDETLHASSQRELLDERNWLIKKLPKRVDRWEGYGPPIQVWGENPNPCEACQGAGLTTLAEVYRLTAYT